MAARSEHTQSTPPGAVVPARLGFLAIFNPSLGNTDETLDDQIVYYASLTTQSSAHRRRRTRGQPTKDISQDERNERLRQIGLAQGMVNFSRGFSGGVAVDAIDTDKARVVLHELEPGWWILASVDLTKVPLPPRLSTKKGEPVEDRYEYSSREMKPASLLLSDLLRAHNIFLMHHDTSLSALFVRTKRVKFITVLSRYWDLHLSTWDVRLHGNPARSVFGGINMAASGELGIGVGEEERGSGEREVLEGVVERIEGLVDLVVSKFGDYDPDGPSDASANQPSAWLGTGQEPGPADGAIFLGTGRLSRKSLRDVTHWMEDLYTWGEHAYGVIDSPTSIRRAKKRRASKSADLNNKPQQPPADVSESEAAKSTTTNDGKPTTPEAGGGGQAPVNADDGRLDKMVSYLTLGYGTYWSLPGGSSDASRASPANEAAPQVEPDAAEESKSSRPVKLTRSTSDEAAGHYLIGLKGEIEENSDDGGPSSDDAGSDPDHNSRTVLRTVHVELESEAADRPEATIVRNFEHPAGELTQSQVVGNMTPGFDSHDLNKAMKLRVVVYVNRPFIFLFLFELRTDSLAWDSLYRSLHHQLAPLRKPLLSSTSYRPDRPGSDIKSTSRAGPGAGDAIYDLIWDPVTLTVHCSIPNIQDNYLNVPETWSYQDAMNTHLQLLNVYIDTRARTGTVERTQKTSRGWWIVWTRILDRSDDLSSTNGNLETIQEAGDDAGESVANDAGSQAANMDARGPAVSKEIFLIRRASDHAGFRTAYSDTAGEGAGKLAQGIGVDTRRYIEELLSLL